MNEQARKKARRAELEFLLTTVWDEGYSFEHFQDWVERQSSSNVGFWSGEAKELIALYEEEG